MISPSPPIILRGRPDSPPEARALRAGPLSVVFESGDLRYIRLGDRELVRRIYVAVRDRNWGTVPARLSDLTVEEGPDRFLVRYAAEHEEGLVHFMWRAVIEGGPDGSLRFEMDGAARSTFLRNRIGFCILHPIRECAGARCRLDPRRWHDTRRRVPEARGPCNPFKELIGLSHEVVPDVWADLRFEGDVFETEDQRNWIDGSFKTFCTPLRLPFPVEIASGSRVRQAVSMTLAGRVDRPPASDDAFTFRVVPDSAVPLPEIGLGQPSDGHLPSGSQLDLLRRLNLSHLRVDLDLGEPGWQEILDRALTLVEALDGSLDVAFMADDEVTVAEGEMGRLAASASTRRHRIGRWLVFSRVEWATPAALVEGARRILEPLEKHIPLVAGTLANFRELNPSPLPWALLDGVCFSAQPQEHATDDASLIENLEGLASTVETARVMALGRPVEVGPITLKKRVNPYATGPSPEPGPGELPARVDPRQMSLFGAAWTLGAIKHLAEQRAARATFFETTGWLGVMETEAGSPLPEKFPSRPGEVFPMYHVFADVNEFRGGEVLPSRSNHPLAADGLVLRLGSICGFCWRTSLRDLEIGIEGLGSQVRIRILDATNALQDAEAARRFRSELGSTHAIVGGRYELTMGPYALVRLDTK